MKLNLNYWAKEEVTLSDWRVSFHGQGREHHRHPPPPALAPQAREKYKLWKEKIWDTWVLSLPILNDLLKVIYEMWNPASEY